ncbi:hypothetical protein V2O64_14150 [Verrucomicrobiaceae bacterium 227]
MKYLPTIVLIGIGITAGWILPRDVAKDSSELTSEGGSERREQIRHRAKQDILSSLLTDEELKDYRFANATSVHGAIEALGNPHGISDSEVARIVGLDPEGALNLLLTDPSASWDVCKKIALGWAYRSPEEAVRFFRNRSSYRAEDCLALILPELYPSHSELVAEVIRSKSLSWQRRHLEDLYTATYQVRNENAPPVVESGDPFADDENWTTHRMGRELLEALDDPELRERASRYLDGDNAEDVGMEPEVETPKEANPLDLANYDRDDWDQRDLFRERMREDREGVLREIVERGSYEARAAAVGQIVSEFPMDAKEWPRALAELEGWIQELGVIPSSPPSHFEMGPFLRGDLSAEWIARQPMALQRAWTPRFVETWAKNEPRAALSWAMTQPEAAGRDQAVQSGVMIWAHSEPLAAARFVEELPAGDIRESAISNAAASWSRVDQAGAAAWLETLPESPAKSRAIERVKGD